MKTAKRQHWVASDRRIGWVSEVVGVPICVIRYHHELGNIPGVRRREKGAHHRYNDAEVQAIKEFFGIAVPA